MPAFTLNIVCGSGMKSVHEAANAIKAGEAEVIVAGGMENMSMAPYLVPNARKGYRMGDGVLQDEMILDGLQCAMNNIHMGITAENVAEKYGITREVQDKIAFESQQKAGAAIKERQVQGRDSARGHTAAQGRPRGLRHRRARPRRHHP